jgi:hypothetical protein
MKRLAILTVALLVLVVAVGWGLVPETISYQGVLTDGAGTPVADGSYDLTFKIYAVASGGTEIWTETQTVSVAGGIFSAILGSLNPLGIPFDAKYWLGVAVNGGAEFAPRRELTATAYSLNARGVADSAITASKIADGTVVRSLNALTDDVTLAAGTNVAIAASGDSLIISAGGGGSGAWSLSGNSGTTAGTDFLGTTDSVALEVKVNGARALRIEPRAPTANLIGGWRLNRVIDGAVGATIGGGGGEGNTWQTVSDSWGTIAGGGNNVAGSDDGTPDNATYATVGGGRRNRATAQYATVAGGQFNTASNVRATVGGGLNNDAINAWATIAGGESNTAGGQWAAVAGGSFNSATGQHATVGGGNNNSAIQTQSAVVGGRGNLASGQWSFVGGGDYDTASAMYATVAGGRLNRAGGNYATVGGGYQNAATGTAAAVAGGSQNSAGGLYSLAAGYRAKISSLHGGAFVFADQNDFDFSSAAQNEFAVRATGGVRFVSAIDGSGTPTAGVELTSGSGSWASLSDRNAKENFVAVDGVAVLEALAAMEISTWNYKTQDAHIRHIGPMAQDFHAAFGVGEDERRISTVDADGVALAAIQGLKRIADEKDARIAELERRLAELERIVALLARESGGGVAVMSDRKAPAE